MTAKHKDTTLLEEHKFWAAMCWVPFFGFIPAFFVMLAEKDREAKWNAIEALVYFGVLIGVLQVAVPIIEATKIFGIVAWSIRGAVGLFALVFGLFMTVRVWSGEQVRLPILSMWADKLAHLKGGDN